MNIVTNAWTAEITIGLQKEYSDHHWSEIDLIEHLTAGQRSLKDSFGILLSAKVTECSIVFLGQVEPSITISFIQYPKFIQDEVKLKEGVLFLANHLMDGMNQNRLVIEFQNETIMIENNEQIDPKIKLNQDN